MARLSQEKISEIVKLYNEIGVYSQVAKMVGCSPATVKKYCSVEPLSSAPKILFNEEVKPISEISFPNNIEELKRINLLSNEEIIEISELWKEI